MNQKVMVIGLDGATFDLIKPWVKEGYLPNFARIMEQGSHGNLMSVIPPLTTPAWASFITGKNPGKHGIFDFAERMDGSYDIRWVTSLSRHGRSLWNIISSHGKKIGAINIPNNYPLEEVNGFIIAWMDAPGSNNFTYPPELAKEIKEKIGDYIITILDWKENEDLSRFQENLHRMIENRTKTTLYLMENKPWDFFAVLFSATDIAQHCFWSYMDSSHPEHDSADAAKFGNTIKEVYRHIDFALGEIQRKMGADTTLVLMSDHGAGPLRRVVHLNKWLEIEGFLKFKKGAGGTGKDGSFPSSLGRKFIHGGLSFLKRNLSHNMRSRLKKVFPGMRDKIEGLLFSSLFDWKGTGAYSLGSYGNIYINLKGREPHGIIEPGEAYDKLCNNITARLIELKDPTTGKRVVKKVYRREEIYHGPFIHKAADLIVLWSDEGYHSVQRFGSEEYSVFGNRLDFHLTNIRYTGHHRLNGIFAIKGEGVKRGVEINSAKIIDLAPTVLYMLGVPVPDDMDGRVLKEVFEEEYIKRKPIQFEKTAAESYTKLKQDVYTGAETDEIAKRLKSLGYIE
jgi:predicted AlkP superfamily phosphohydrolase/phosphomutase